MSDFSPESRNSAWWSGDSRLAAQGKANEAILRKLGKLEIPDLSHIEAVQMGHVMEPVIGSLAADQLKIELTKIEEGLSHKTEPWLKSHFDFHGLENGKPILVECKNYNAGVRNKFDADTKTVPDADYAQMLHEATVYGCETVYLAILFGGQEFFLCDFTFTAEQKEEHVKQCAVYWSHVQAGTTLPPETPEQCRVIYPQHLEASKTASKTVEEACGYLRRIKDQIKVLEAQKDNLETLIMGYMGESSLLSSIGGDTLATWKNAKTSERFDSKLFQSAMPEVYEKFVINQPGSRRFLLK
jgi:predicted phage-related endonuclease